jgi:Raf kinase inhibitor-like YbhB/YbcL family protein
MLCLAVGLAVAGCGFNAEGGGKKMSLQVSSSAFGQGKVIPKKYTGEGEDVSPPLAWSDVPAGTKELALVCDDPDAPRTDAWVHWVIYKIPADAQGLPEGVERKPRPKAPAGAMQGENSWPEGENIGYRGPMPPPGHGVHHYYFKLFALDTELSVEPGLDKKAILDAIRNHVLADGVLMGTYERKKR